MLVLFAKGSPCRVANESHDPLSDLARTRGMVGVLFGQLGTARFVGVAGGLILGIGKRSELSQRSVSPSDEVVSKVQMIQPEIAECAR